VLLLPYLTCHVCQDFKRAGISRLLKEKGREQFWSQKGQFASYKEKLEKFIEFHHFYLGSIKCFPLSFNTFNTLYSLGGS
jgi:hypothetical protein